MYTKKSIIQSVISTILLNGVLPFVVYIILKSYYSNLFSLIIATIIPLLDIIYGFCKNRKIDVFNCFMLVGFLLGIIALLFGGNEKIILLRESFVTGIMGMLFLLSLFLQKPLIYYFAKRFTTNDYERFWDYDYFRFVIRFITIVWGISLLLEAMIKAYLVFSLSTTAFLAVSPIIFYGILAVVILWTIYYRRYSKHKLDQIIH
ncbi:VC0807 family protein [Bacillus sp. FJAT-49736]|uniref:VC0807 family protein n=1 Tax=Bacillus sp. FJAT-49736 TaxID=2833582 RepID=UPI001BCA2A37|nr:VC0807 family protein [Bacillus sp. FJAT-49736]